MRIALALITLFSFGCSAQLGTVHCDSGDDCPVGSYCSVAKQCADPQACMGDPASACAVGTPDGLAAAGGRLSVALSWNTVSGATGYDVRRAIVSGGPYFDVAMPASAGLDDQGLSPATTYYYVVHAIGPGGAGADSDEASALTVPDAPADLSATAGAGQIALTWNPVPAASGYQILRASDDGVDGGADDGVFAPLATAGTSPTSYLDANLNSGDTWIYEVVALDATGAGPASLPATATAQ